MIRIFGLVLASFFAFEAFEKILTIKYFSFILNFAENTVPWTLTITYSILELHEISSKCGIQMSILAEMDSSQINGHWSVLMRATALILMGFTSLQDHNKNWFRKASYL